MKILSSDFKKGNVSLHIEDLDDLWQLSHIIDPGDFVKAKTTRKIKIGDSENAKVTKKTLTLTIEAQTIELTDSSLRINGKIREGPDDLPFDVYQAISLEPTSQFFLTKPNWPTFQKQKLQEATKPKSQQLFCILDREEALFARTTSAGFEILTRLKGQVAKKDRKVDIRIDFHSSIIQALNEYNDRFTPQTIILASPAFYKEELAAKLSQEPIAKKIVQATCSSVTKSALNELLKRPEVASALANSRALIEENLISTLLTHIKKADKVAYGEKEVQLAADQSAISTLLITDQLIKLSKEKEQFAKLDNLMRHVDTMQGKIHILTSTSDPGKKLDGLGSIAAILRFNI